MKTLDQNRLLILLLAAIGALLSAYISQYTFNFQPCTLCLYQRKPFFAIIAVSAIALVFLKSPKQQRIALFLCALLLITNIGIAGYHVGVEQKIFQGPTSCSPANNLNQITNLEELKASLKKTKAVKCDIPAFLFLGLSMAAWNFIYCLGLLVFALKKLKNKNI